MKIDVNKKAVGSRIKQIRINKGYTLEALGKLFGASKGNVQKWEKGLALPNKERIANICKIADITVNELLYGSIEEFLKTNYDNLILNSNYPYKASFSNFNLINRTIIEIDNSFIISFDKKEKVSINDINTIIDTFNITLDYVVKTEILPFIDNNIHLLKQYNREVTYILNDELLRKAIYYLYKGYDYKYINEIRNRILHDYTHINNLQTLISHELSNEDNSIDDINENFDFYNALLELVSKDEKTKVATYFFFDYIILLLKRETSYHMELVKCGVIYLSYNTLINDNTNLYNIIYDFTFHLQSEGYFLDNNRYNINNYKNVIALYIEKENCMYYLANHNNIEEVPLNTEVDYFILNHDNTYQITKITEKPDCKYLAPILGKME